MHRLLNARGISYTASDSGMLVCRDETCVTQCRRSPTQPWTKLRGYTQSIVSVTSQLFAMRARMVGVSLHAILRYVGWHALCRRKIHPARCVSKTCMYARHMRTHARELRNDVDFPETKQPIPSRYRGETISNVPRCCADTVRVRRLK